MQIEYALNAVSAGATSLGVKAVNGVVMATEKKMPSVLIDETSMQKILMLTENIAVRSHLASLAITAIFLRARLVACWCAGIG